MPRITIGGGTPAIIYGNVPPRSTNNLGQAGIAFVRLDPVQVAGLIPLMSCSSVECREVCGDGWKNPVFGELVGGAYRNAPTYENDFSTFLIDVSILKSSPSTQIQVGFVLEKFFNGEWKPYPFGLNLNSNAYGTYYPLGGIPSHPTYAGYSINWGAVLFNVGAGCYRFKAYSVFLTTRGEGSYTYGLGCLQSPPFDLKAWDCFQAHGTVKFESVQSGIIGDPYTDYKKHDLCNFPMYDSVRTYGYFGYEKSPEYKTNNLKWGTPYQGKIEQVNDEQIQRWEYNSKYLPEYLHSRFATFAMMSNFLLVSDYNINNSNYTYKRKYVKYDSGYEPEYIDKEAYWKRKNKSKVQVFFKRGVQSVIKSNCCPTT